MLVKDKVIVVSGIGPGLGIELSTLAAKEGARAVVVCARTASKLDDAEAAIRAEGLDTEVLKIPTDISNREQCKALVEQTIDKFGRIDGLINSAYVGGSFTPIENADLDDWRQTMDINFFGSMNLTLEATPHMKNQGNGAVVMVNSMVTRRPMMTQGGYAASKGALKTATAYLANELGPHGIRVNSTFMGWMWGPPVETYMKMTAKQHDISIEEAKQGVAANIPIREIPDDADCAKAVLFLVSDYAKVISGANLDVNGGEYLPC